MVNPDPLEKVIEAKVCQRAAELGVLVYKFTSPNRRSVPDRIFFYKGKTWLIEFKRRGQRPTAAQEVEISKLIKHGVQVFVVDDVALGRELVERMCGL